MRWKVLPLRLRFSSNTSEVAAWVCFAAERKARLSRPRPEPSSPVAASRLQQHLEGAKRIKPPPLHAWIKHLARNFPRSGEMGKKILSFPKAGEKATPPSRPCPRRGARGLQTLQGGLWLHDQTQVPAPGPQLRVQNPRGVG